jgi:hypothetical protein
MPINRAPRSRYAVAEAEDRPGFDGDVRSADPHVKV